MNTSSDCCLPESQRPLFLISSLITWLGFFLKFSNLLHFVWKVLFKSLLDSTSPAIIQAWVRPVKFHSAKTIVNNSSFKASTRGRQLLLHIGLMSREVAPTWQSFSWPGIAPSIASRCHGKAAIRCPATALAYLANDHLAQWAVTMCMNNGCRKLKLQLPYSKVITLQGNVHILSLAFLSPLTPVLELFWQILFAEKTKIGNGAKTFSGRLVKPWYDPPGPHRLYARLGCIFFYTLAVPVCIRQQQNLRVFFGV